MTFEHWLAQMGIQSHALTVAGRSSLRAQYNAQHGGRRGGTIRAAVITAAMSITAGIAVDAVAKQLPASEREQVMNEATSGTMRGFGLHAAMDAVIHAAGGHFHGSRSTNEFIRAALSAERQLQAARDLGDGVDVEANGFTTMSLSGILSNVANKGLLASYNAVEVAWPQVAAVRNLSDFKPHVRYRLDSTGAFKKVAADGELKHIGLSDASYTNQLATYGAIIALTRQMMINDDLGAFNQIPEMLGRLAALRVEEAVFKLLLANLSTLSPQSGIGSALGVAGLGTAEKVFRNAVDSNGKPILLTPNRILVGSTLATAANQLYRDTTLIADGVASTSSVRPAGNPCVGKYQPIVSPYIDNTAITDQDGKALTGQSATLWLMLADPAIRAAIAVGFLNGQRTPTIESSQADFDTLGMQWRAYEDFGVGMEETTAAVANAGA